MFDPRMDCLIHMCVKAGVKPIFLTGRPSSVQIETSYWINNNFLPSYELIMRPANDNRPGETVKKELWKKYVEPYYNTICVFEDSNKCVNMWRELGLLTCQVANADY